MMYKIPLASTYNYSVKITKPINYKTIYLPKN